MASRIEPELDLIGLAESRRRRGRRGKSQCYSMVFLRGFFPDFIAFIRFIVVCNVHVPDFF